MARGRILLAHGNIDCQTIYGSVLRFAGYTVDVVDTVDAALEHLASGEYDALVADLYLTVIEQSDDCLLRQIRLAPFGMHLPTVILTAWTTDLHQHLARDVGADRFLVLPAAPRQLLLVVEELLEHGHTPDIGPSPVPRLPDRPIANGL
jgi:DNA-binding response OmpR family regulator